MPALTAAVSRRYLTFSRSSPGVKARRRAFAPCPLPRRPFLVANGAPKLAYLSPFHLPDVFALPTAFGARPGSTVLLIPVHPPSGGAASFAGPVRVAFAPSLRCSEQRRWPEPAHCRVAPRLWGNG